MDDAGAVALAPAFLFSGGGKMDLKDIISAVSQFKSIVSDDVYLSSVIALLLVFLVVSSLVKLFELIVKAISAIKDCLVFLIDAFRGGVKYREHVQRRNQFLSALSSDLATIGKAEAWNDQNFTDLEAEVQVDGGYFATIFDRLRKHRSYGQRRERSLIGAIDGSAEKCLLLTGDPGAGKSVALRHLAVQMIERAKKSRRMYEPVPLYINLRELNLDGKVDSSSIKKFIIDNVRRGDADTAEYLSANWSSFHENGGWFFLFDSFDEIPEVLHAANEDVQIDKYGHAIQQFMDGLGGCRGVLASREYKSPKALAWPKLRILPLNEGLQEKLINNTFLSKEQKLTALRTLSTSRSATYRNPLFLTLLCRYVREHNSGPKNEHQLLYRHVESLCERDEEYVVSRWELSPELMKQGAAELAIVFALAPDIGLSPSVEELSVLAEKSSFLKGRIERVIEALTYVKVGRMDIASASRKERRFAFSHRRYHEAIFAKHLSDNEALIDPADLLCNPRWREYVVAMLQTHATESGHVLIDTAGKLITAQCALISFNEERFSGEVVRTYAWRDEILIHLLKLMVDVKTFNPSPSWRPVEDAVEQLFSPLWKRGDLFDRLMIIRYGGAGRAEAHSKRIEYARESGIVALQEEAVNACQFATMPSSQVAVWIRERVARRIVTSSKNRDALKWEALAAQLPSAYESSVCVERAKGLRRQHKYARFFMMPFLYFLQVMTSFDRNKSTDQMDYKKFRFAMLAVNMIPMFAVIGAVEPMRHLGAAIQLKSIFIVLMAICLMNLLVTHIRLENLALPSAISLKDVIRTFKVDYKMPFFAFIASALFIAVLTLPGLAFLYILRSLDISIGLKDSEAMLVGTFMTMIAIWASIFVYFKRSNQKMVRLSLKNLNSRKSLRSAVNGMLNTGAVEELCGLAIGKPSISYIDIRRTITLLSSRLTGRATSKLMNPMYERDITYGVSILLSEYAKAKGEGGN
ncbi:NACHT domain-containing protein [Xanthomonas citri]|uniref:NACHT domain-containing protein n=1 Tax=Xanthomonas citri TaxID=346 RepID=UPI0009B869C1|nr:NACHT domain-containing protein [Xanthomonas citri]PNV29346.1 NACHT domain-containing protein [Xanthomonas citri]WPM77242.1 NACHT domain-containing protein [Xanthomonas citri pv. viticola]